MKRNRIACVIPNWDGIKTIGKALDALQKQQTKAEVTIIVVDNGSVDGSSQFVRDSYPGAIIVQHDKNYGFAGGVNGGIRKAMQLKYDYVALFNNDASADDDWLDHLWRCLEEHSEVGIATGKLITSDGKQLDSTGEGYSTWGLPFPRGRGEPISDKYDDQTDIFAASGGASMYRVAMLEQIGIFDDDFFAYYEDVDISFRAQLAGWKVRYVPGARAYHDIGVTSGRIKGFTTYQTLKNLPLVIWKNLPARYFWHVLPRFTLAYWLFFASAIARGQWGMALKGLLQCAWLTPKKLLERRSIQKHRVVGSAYIWGNMLHDLPPNAHRLQRLRNRFTNIKRTKVAS
jgi:GT2 family glycosyltransferase